MNRTARLYALVEELRAAAPRALTVAALAARLEVSTRTVQRDLQALMETGVPVRTTPGRGGGWSIDPAMTLPPIHFTPDEAAVLAAALAGADGSTAARTAFQKIAAVLNGPATAAAGDLAARIVALPSRTDAGVRAAVHEALATNTVLRLTYTDAAGQDTERVVDPAGLLTADGRWYLIAWCRTRRAGRGFRLDRITSATLTGEDAQRHDLSDLLRGSLAAGAVRPATLDPLNAAMAPSTSSGRLTGREGATAPNGKAQSSFAGRASGGSTPQSMSCSVSSPGVMS
ncbi:helix-turn-helix transcriptional regulator [Lentzea flava]|uniref:helix-turn-helix transcriptional regulator n=1 Tax=Lentzea flava TaxID=103732 RepID=UPI001670A965|nr:YafY family protein [Lentzea flava]